MNDLNFDSNEADEAKNLDFDGRSKVDETSGNAEPGSNGKVEVVVSNCHEVEGEGEDEGEDVGEDVGKGVGVV